MATLQINDRFRLSGDEHCWTLEKAAWVDEDSKTGQKLLSAGAESVSGRVPVWTGFRYYPDLSRACTDYIRLTVRTSPAENIAEIRIELEQAKAEIAAMLKVAGLGGI